MQGLGRTAPDGHAHAVHWSQPWLAEQIKQVRRDEIGGITIDQARSKPYLLVGTADEIARKIETTATEQGITYFVVRTLDDFAPVIAAFR